MSRYIIIILSIIFTIYTQDSLYAYCVPDTNSHINQKSKSVSKTCYLIGSISRLSFDDFLLYTGELGVVYGSFTYEKAHGDLFSKGGSGIRLTMESSIIDEKILLGSRLGYEWLGFISARVTIGCYTNFNHQYSFTLNPEVGFLYGIVMFGVHLPVLGNEIIKPSFRLSLQVPFYELYKEK